MCFKICAQKAKSAPWFVHYGCVPGLYPNLNNVVTTFILKPTQPPHIAVPLGLISSRSETLENIENKCIFEY